MKGFRVERRWGWDCHGLPIENIAEKELGIKEKTEIEDMGVSKFNEFCRTKVSHYAGEWKKTVLRLGQWVEFDNSYKTMDNSYMETVWWIFKKLYDEDSIYEGKKVLLFCPRCETPLAKSEIAMDKSYKDVTEKAVFAKFNLKDEGASILAFTTTPWTLIGNAALAVNKDLIYVKVKTNGENLILAKECLNMLEGDFEVVEEFPGSGLLNKNYEPLYKLETDKKGYYVIDGGEEVSSEEGSGVVHMATYGEFDYEMIKKHDLPVFLHVDTKGKLVEGPKDWLGLWFKKVDNYVIEDLEERNLLYRVDNYSHAYPFCYRCETPLLYYAISSWFINIQKVKSRLLERNKEINWKPEHLRDGRFKHILDTAPDWTISRNRYWATSLPVWKCEDCKAVKVFGSVKELQKVAVEDVHDNVDLHKHVMDKVHVACDCGKQMTRIPEVFDCWLEAASMPYASKHYPFENEELMQKTFPADFVTEYVGQTRAWFYYMHAMGVLLFDKAPFKNVIVFGNVLAADGAKMSKSKKNFPDPALIFEKYGADALRLYLMGSQVLKGEDLNFKEDGVKEVFRKVVMLLNNVHKFYLMFGAEQNVLEPSKIDHVLDRWILSRLHLLVRDVSHYMENYNSISATNDIQKFIEDLSIWYVRRSRDRFKSADEEESKVAVETLAYCLHMLSKVLAPIAPFISESIHQSFREAGAEVAESVHLESWPLFHGKLIDDVLNEDMKKTRGVVSKALDEREKAKVPIRQALAKLEFYGVDLSKEFLDLIRDELNVKEVVAKGGEEFKVVLDVEITPELRMEGIAREFVRKVNNYRKNQGFTIKDRITLYLQTDDKLVIESFNKHVEEIKHSVQADKVEFEVEKGEEGKMITINGSKIRISVRKV